jgi:hypothetical protein
VRTVFDVEEEEKKDEKGKKLMLRLTYTFTAM